VAQSQAALIQKLLQQGALVVGRLPNDTQQYLMPAAAAGSGGGAGVGLQPFQLVFGPAIAKSQAVGGGNSGRVTTVQAPAAGLIGSHILQGLPSFRPSAEGLTNVGGIQHVPIQAKSETDLAMKEVKVISSNAGSVSDPKSVLGDLPESVDQPNQELSTLVVKAEQSASISLVSQYIAGGVQQVLSDDSRKRLLADDASADGAVDTKRQRMDGDCV
jgi:hypothetical protein